MKQPENDLMLPTHHKMGANGKGERAVLLRHSYVKVIIGTIFALAFCAAFLFADLGAERQMFSSTTGYMHAIEEAQRLSKVEAEAKMSEVAGVLSATVAHAQAESSDLKLMGQHILYIQNQAREEVLGADMTDKDRAKAFDKMNTDVKAMIAQHLQRLDKALATDHSTATQVHEDIAEELKHQETDDKELKKEEDAAMQDVATGNFHHLDHKKASKEIDEIEARMTAVFHHVDDLANKMGSTDIDALLESSHVAEWEQLLTDTESGKVAYPTGIKKMEAILEKIPAALKLAEATGSIKLIEADGGKKGVTEITNFRNLLREVKRLPQYAAVLEEFDAWKKGHRTVQQVLLWVQKNISAKKLDGDWLSRASALSVEREPTSAAQS